MIKEMRSSSWLSPAQAALALRVTTQRVRQLMSGGVLRYERTALGRLIDPESVVSLQEERKARCKGAQPEQEEG